MRFGSVCSGIEAASAAWEPLGWKAAWFSEIEPFPSAVLAHHYPHVPNLGDMTHLPAAIRAGDVEAPDVLCGGTPCQAFSVAGNRRSLDDARGNLSLVFCEIANAIDDERAAAGLEPGIVVWENVPGVLSTKDNAFGCFLAGLAGEDDPLVAPGGKWTDAGCVFGPERAVAWRILDAQYFGLAQRRRRVFVVASARDNFDPAAVLFEFEGLRRDSAPSREAGQNAAASSGAGAGSGGYVPDATGALTARSARNGGQSTDDVDGHKIVTMAHGQGGAEIGFDRGPTLTCIHEAPIAAYPAPSDDATSGVQYAHPVEPPPAYTFRADAMRDGVAKTPSPDAEGRVRLRDPGMGMYEELAPTLDCGAAHGVAQPVEPFTLAIRGRGDARDLEHRQDGTANALLTPNGRHDGVMTPAMQVRRLTPRECEALMGFPRDYTAIPWRGKPASECPDGPRYKALGNSWAVPVVRWVGYHIQGNLK